MLFNITLAYLVDSQRTLTRRINYCSKTFFCNSNIIQIFKLKLLSTTGLTFRTSWFNNELRMCFKCNNLTFLYAFIRNFMVYITFSFLKAPTFFCNIFQQKCRNDVLAYIVCWSICWKSYQKFFLFVYFCLENV